MKKIIACMACVALCLSVAACSAPASSSSSTSSTSSESSTSSASSEASSESSASSEAATGETTDLATFLEENKAEIEKAIAGQSNESLSVSVTADENVLQYLFQFKTDIGDAEAVAEELNAGLEESAETVTTMLNSIKLAVPSAEAIRFIYADMDGNEIVSKDFK